jgi:hypothetical protein
MIDRHGWNSHEGSSHIDSSKYDADNRTLDVKFQNGSIYRYHGVPPGEHQSFLAASSQGEYHAAYIKHYYHCEQIK